MLRTRWAPCVNKVYIILSWLTHSDSTHFPIPEAYVLYSIIYGIVNI